MERIRDHAAPDLGRRPRVLLAEDDQELRRMLAAELRKEGMIVDDVGSGFGLLEHIGALTLRHRSIDLIVTDVRMPGVNGLAVVEGLRNSGRAGSWATPVLVITAFGDKQTHDRARRLGAELLDKPFELADFRVRATSMVSGRATPPVLEEIP